MPTTRASASFRRFRWLYVFVLAASLLYADGVVAQDIARTNCDGLTTASVILSSEMALVFMVGFGDGRALLEVAFLARGAAGWNDSDLTFQPWLRPKLPDSTGYLTGAGVGRLFLQYEPHRRIAWVGTQRIPVRSGNVVVIDSAHTESPVIQSVVSLSSRLDLSDPCRTRHADDHELLRRSVLQLLMADSYLRRVIENRGSSEPGLAVGRGDSTGS